jgi:hypothetical protein
MMLGCATYYGRTDISEVLTVPITRAIQTKHNTYNSENK